MSASKCGQRAVNRGEIGLKADLVSQKSPSSEIGCINSRSAGCCADLPLYVRGLFLGSGKVDKGRRVARWLIFGSRSSRFLCII